MNFFSFLRVIEKKWQLLAIGLICLIIIVSHTLYVLKTHQYPEQDEHVYLSFAVQFYDILKHPSKDTVWQIFQVNRFRQPLYGLFLTLPILIVGTAHTYKIALWFNVIFYIATIVGIYFLAKEFLSKTASFLAGLIFAFYGFPLFYLHFTYSETAVTAFVVLSLLFLSKSKKFSDRKYVFWFSVFFLLGNLMRWVVPLFVGGSFLYALCLGILDQTDKKKRNLRNFLVNILIFIGISLVPILAIFYIPNIFYFKAYVGQNVAYGSEWMTTMVHPDLPGIQHAFSIHSIMFYFNILSEQTVFFFVLFLLGFLLGIRFYKKYTFLTFGFLFAYAVFTLGSVLKFDRYIVPIYPLMAVISSIVFDHIKNKILLNSLIFVTILIGFLNFIGSSWAIGPMGRQGLKDIVLPSFVPHPRRIYLTPMVWPPRREELNADLYIDAIQKDFGRQKRLPKVLSTAAYHPFDNAAYSIITYEKRNIISADTIRGIKEGDYQTLFEKINNTDYLVIKDKDPIEKYIIDDQTQSYMLHRFNNAASLNESFLPSEFKLIDKIHIPLDNSNILIYRRISKITQQDWENFGMLFGKENPSFTDKINEAVKTVENEKTN